MTSAVIFCFFLWNAAMLTRGEIIVVPKSQSLTWTYNMQPGAGVSSRVTVVRGGYATIYISLSGMPTPEQYDEKYIFVEGFETALYYPGESKTFYVLIVGNDESDVEIEGYVKDGKLDGCDFNFCSADEKCLAVSDTQLRCTAA